MIKIIFKSGKIHFFVFIGAIIIIAFLYFVTPNLLPTTFHLATTVVSTSTKDTVKVYHINTPKSVKSIYMTSCVASTPKLRENLLNIIKNTEINSIVIDIKDFTGTIAFQPKNIIFSGNEGKGCKTKDLKEFISELHKNNIYVIGRISVFQDHFLVNKMPELAVKRKSDGMIWKDFKGISWFDAGAKEIWDYVVKLARESYAIGFDEINFDYIRFPSDGDMKDIYYPFSEGVARSEVIREFFSYLNENLRKNDNIIISADVFGMTTTNYNDLNIGQILENALDSFDYVSPMVYPSHYPKGFLGFENPAEKPYEIIKYSMDVAFSRAILASSSPSKLRPWLQDFDLGADYDAEKIRMQIQATYDSGLDSWMMWNASNRYTIDAFLLE